MTPLKSRLDVLKELAAKDPKNAFPRYGLAMELTSLGRLDEAAEAFQSLARDLPDYVPTYYQAGRVMEKLGRTDAARSIYEQGMAAATRAGNGHAREELEAAVALLQ